MKLGYYAVIIRLICGFIFGFSFSLFTSHTVMTVWRRPCHSSQLYTRYNNLADETNSRELVLIAVMTHWGNIWSRAFGIHRTWAREIPGKLLFFVGQSENRTKPAVDLPLVVLPVDDDVYPPQEKSMVMLKYVYENFADRFRWFIRADDDVFFLGDNLARLLRSVDSDDDILLGHPGTGRKDEKEKLGLDKNSNFCLGGTGIVMSHSVLEKVYPHLDYCLKNTASEHEDTEVGRCLRKFVGVQCPWGYEANEFFHQEYGNASNAYRGDLKSILFEKAVSLHPVKDFHIHYRLYVRSFGTRMRLIQYRTHKYREQLKRVKKLLITSEQRPFQRINLFHCYKDLCEQFHRKVNFRNKSGPHSGDFTTTWTLFLDSQNFHAPPCNPVHLIQEDVGQHVVEKTELIISDEDIADLYHSFYFGKYIAGYYMRHPLYGNLYEVQYFVRTKRDMTGALHRMRIPKRVKIRESFGSVVSRLVEKNTDSELVNVVLPLSGSDIKSFQRFLKRVEKLLVKFNERSRVIVVCFREMISPKPYKLLFDSFKKRLHDAHFVWLETASNYSSFVVLQTAFNYFEKTKNSLLFFSHIDVLFEADFFKRCRQNTAGGNVYIPVPFRVYSSLKNNEKIAAFDKELGQWSFDDFSIFCAYSDDILASKLLHSENASSQEIPLVEQFLGNSNHVVNVFRGPDPGLLRIVTKTRCADMNGRDCIYSTFSSTKSLFDYMLKKNYIGDFL